MTSSIDSPLFVVSHLTTSFINQNDEFVAVNDLSFNVYPGKTLGIVGESGSGKSVTSLSVMRLLNDKIAKVNQNSKATLNVNPTLNVDLLNVSQNELRKHRGNDIAMIFQEPMTSLNPVFTCGQQVAEVIRLHRNLSKKEAKLETIALFEKVKLPRPLEMFNAYPHQLSGGQKQRVMIAMAISCNPKILIADEPTTALDVTVQSSILDLLRDLQKEFGMGMIFITHDLGVIKNIADQMIVMYKGKVVESGDANSILNAPQHPYTRGLLACRPNHNVYYKRLPVISDFMTWNTDGTISSSDFNIDHLVQEKSSYLKSKNERLESVYHNKPILQVNDLTVSYVAEKSFFGKPTKFVNALNGVSFDVFKGETLGLVGESGCGKSTLGKTILKLIEPTSGSIMYDGNIISSYNNKQMKPLRKRLQLIFQDPYSSLNPRMTIGNAIMEPMIVHQLYSSHDECKAHTIELLKRVGLSDSSFNRYPHQFSGGQRQRICIARALAVKPEFIVCDESVSALDVSVQAQVLNLLNELKQENNLTYIFISHDLSVVRYMSDRIMVMQKGIIEELDTTDEVCNRPKSDYTKKLLMSIPELVS